ncbi:DUF3000 domain-containing protein [soil metagenome]
MASMNAAVLRPEIFCEPMPAPQRIAPYASAITADLTVDDDEVGTGRLILLHDPDGNEAWGHQTFRCVAYCRVDIEVEQAGDPFLGEVAWSWLTEALESHGADAVAIAGTVTKVSTESFGGMADEGAAAQVEVRASWSPVLSDSFDVAPHVQAWAELLCAAAGLPPVPEGVAVLANRRGQRG